MGGYLEVEDWALLSISPERFLRSDGYHAETKPIKGTRPRMSDPEADREQFLALENSTKDKAENLMIVDLLRNDLGRTCEVGSVSVSGLFAIESFSNVHHLVSTVSGNLAAPNDPLDLLMHAFPGGSITGAPKHRAMQIIDELEPHCRELYCGSLLYFDVLGRMDSNILIRSLVAKNGVIRCWGGGGVVADSTAPAEFQEIKDKIGNILNSLL
jgi:para-aminobenzoate synthetase component 1